MRGEGSQVAAGVTIPWRTLDTVDTEIICVPICNYCILAQRVDTPPRRQCAQLLISIVKSFV